MKILIVNNGPLSQISKQYYLHNEIRSFLLDCCSLGMDVSYASSVIETMGLNLGNTVMPDQIHVEKIPVISSLPFYKKIACIPFALFVLNRIIIKYDFFYCFYPGTVSSAIIFLAVLFRKKYALNVRCEVSDNTFSRFAISHAHFILAVGRSIVEKICPDYKKCRDIVPMTNVFYHEFKSSPKTAFHNPLKGLFVGRVSKGKGCFELLEAMKRLKERAIPVTMNLVGTFSPEFEEFIQRNDINDCVKLCGLTHSVDELHQHYEEADFFCLPTWTEGFPRVLYEAMGHGLPCITTMVGGIPSRMHDGENCIAINVRDPESIVNAILTLFQSPDKMKHLSLASLKTFQYWKTYFAGQTHAKQIMNEISQIEK